MNAYELADELAECIIDGSTDLVCVAQAANMLRQQADEFDKVVPQLVKANGLIENLRLRIAELEKNLHMVQRHYDQLNTQTKPLSDEEINLLKAEIAAHKKTNELLSKKIIELERHNKK
jgi:septal ring factor EnvC (AmiA/AmiB activator)